MVIALDLEGVIMNSMPALIDLSIECARKYFNLEIKKEEVEKAVLHFSGGTFREGFSKTIELFFPGHEKEKYEKCYKEIQEKRAAIYAKAEPFPEVIEVIKKLSNNFHLALSSGLERSYLEGWLTRIGIMNLFEVIFGGEDGNGKKKEHIQMLREKYPDERIVFVGDSLSEMELGDKAIGVARQIWQAQPLKEAGASAIISSLDQLFGFVGD